MEVEGGLFPQEMWSGFQDIGVAVSDYTPD